MHDGDNCINICTKDAYINQINLTINAHELKSYYMFDRLQLQILTRKFVSYMHMSDDYRVTCHCKLAVFNDSNLTGCKLDKYLKLNKHNTVRAGKYTAAHLNIEHHLHAQDATNALFFQPR